MFIEFPKFINTSETDPTIGVVVLSAEEEAALLKPKKKKGSEASEPATDPS